MLQYYIIRKRQRMRLALMEPDRKRSSPTESDFRWNEAREHSGAGMPRAMAGRCVRGTR